MFNCASQTAFFYDKKTLHPRCRSSFKQIKQLGLGLSGYGWPEWAVPWWTWDSWRHPFPPWLRTGSVSVRGSRMWYWTLSTFVMKILRKIHSGFPKFSGALFLWKSHNFKWPQITNLTDFVTLLKQQWLGNLAWWPVLAIPVEGKFRKREKKNNNSWS